jgi:MFS-type transporter involved in bile tolerance (Atg22 family)
MYIQIFLIICMATCMHRIAEREKRRGWLWASITGIVIVLLGQLLQSAYAPSIAGFIVCFILMTLANIYKPVNKGPF